ncbi:MAG: hypothetical protein ACK5L5_05440, partial [Bacteroidales bacterium]
SDKKMMVLWLRFLTEIKDGTSLVPNGMSESEELVQALSILQESAFTIGELESYDRYWDIVSRERTLISGKSKEGLEEGMREGMEKGMREGMEKGIIKGRKEGREEGRIKGKEEGKIEMAKKLLQSGVAIEIIMTSSGLSKDEIEKLDC